MNAPRAATQTAPHKTRDGTVAAWLKTQYRLAFQPDLNAIFCLDRARLNLATLAMLWLNGSLAAFWTFIYPTEGINALLLIFCSFWGLGAFLNLHYRFIPWPSQLAVVMTGLWINIPLVGIYLFLAAPLRMNALAMTTIMLILYMNIQDWRSSLLGILAASVLAPLLFLGTQAHWPHLTWLPLMMLTMAVGGAITVAVSASDQDKLRTRHARKVLRVTEHQLQPMLRMQEELVGNLRYEAKNILQDAALCEQAQHIAATLQEQLQDLEFTLSRLSETADESAWMGGISTIGMGDLLELALHDLGTTHHLSQHAMQSQIQIVLQGDFFLDVSRSEVSQALAALLWAGLPANADANPAPEPQQETAAEPNAAARTKPLRIHAQRLAGHRGQLRISRAMAAAAASSSPAPSSAGADKACTTLPAALYASFSRFDLHAKITRRHSDGTWAEVLIRCYQPCHSARPSDARA